MSGIDSELSLELSIGGGKYGISTSNDSTTKNIGIDGFSGKKEKFEDLGLSLFTQKGADTGSRSSPRLGARFCNVKAVHMPCVTTTGNGAGGRTVRGFLYKYTNAEVSIVCVCHGSSFSPAGFVEHAGGVGESHPLRQITVLRSDYL